MINFRVTKKKIFTSEENEQGEREKEEKRSTDVLSCSSRAHCQVDSASIKINEKIS